MLKLAPSAEEGEALLTTLRACNAAATRAAAVAFEHQTANKVRLQALCYAELREQFGLSAQMAIRAIAKACEAYKREKKIQPRFRPLGAVAYDQRILSWKGCDRVSILTLAGRITVPVAWQGRWRGTAGTKLRGAADLIYRDGSFGIRGRVTVRTAQRADAHSWAFWQLRRFIVYKAALAGVPAVLVDPRNTSRECPGCGHIDKANRPSRDVFACRRCGLAGPADHIAARNIAGRAAVMQPDAARHMAASHAA
jgi:predicted transposase